MFEFGRWEDPQGWLRPSLRLKILRSWVLLPFKLLLNVLCFMSMRLCPCLISFVCLTVSLTSSQHSRLFSEVQMLQYVCNSSWQPHSGTSLKEPCEKIWPSTDNKDKKPPSIGLWNLIFRRDGVPSNMLSFSLSLVQSNSAMFQYLV